MKIVNYFKEMYEELVHKTSWPTMQVDVPGCLVFF